MNPETNKFEPISAELMEKFNRPDADLTEHEKKQRNWTKFHLDEVIHIKGIAFKVARIEPNQLLLRPVVKEKD